MTRSAIFSNLVIGRKPRPAHEQRWGMPIPSVDQSLALMLLPTVLSLIAGSCDIITFIGLGGLFTAHITGSFRPEVSTTGTIHIFFRFRCSLPRSL